MKIYLLWEHHLLRWALTNSYRTLTQRVIKVCMKTIILNVPIGASQIQNTIILCRNQTQFHIHYLQKWTVRHLFHYCKNNKSLISLYMIRVVKQTWIISRLLKHYKLAHLLVVLPFKNENWNCSTCLGTRYWIIKESSCIISSNLHNLTSYK